MTRVLVCGGRDYAEREHAFSVLDGIHKRIGITILIHGGATGADSLAAEWAMERGIEPTEYKAAWTNLNVPGARIRCRRDGTLYNAAAGSQRNQRMLDEGKPSVVVAFSGGRGTADMVRRAYKHNLLVMTVRITERLP